MVRTRGTLSDAKTIKILRFRIKSILKIYGKITDIISG
jgi:hypothetical protein